MRILKSKRGVGLVDVIVTLLIVGTTGLVFATSFPAAFSCLTRARENKVATAIAQQKIEQLRAMNYESLSQPLLLAAGAIDSTPGSSPYSFTQVDNVAGQLTRGTGTLEITDFATDVKRVRVTITWNARVGQPTRRLQITTLFADKRTRKVG